MSKKDKNWIQDFTSPVGMKISKAWFITFANSKSISDFLYENEIDYKNKKIEKIKKLKKETVVHSVKKRFTQWNKMKFFEESRIIRVKTWRRGSYYYPKTKLYRLNLEPLYLYCKEKYGIDFTEKEKEFLKWHFKLGQISWMVFFEYPEENFFNAILKFYVKNYVMPYGYLTRLAQNPVNHEMIKEFEKAKQKAEEMNKNKLIMMGPYSKEQQKRSEEFFRRGGFSNEEARKKAEQMKKIHKEVNKSIKNKEYDYIDVLSHNPETNLMETGFADYVREYKENPELILNIDKKFMQALGILPQ